MLPELPKKVSGVSGLYLTQRELQSTFPDHMLRELQSKVPGENHLHHRQHELQSKVPGVNDLHILLRELQSKIPVEIDCCT